MKLLILISCAFFSFFSLAKHSLLDEAYRKEMAYLMAQKAELSKKLSILQKSYVRKTSAAKKDIIILQKKYIDIHTSNELLMERASSLERDVEALDENKLNLENTMKQANFTLKESGFQGLVDDIGLANFPTLIAQGKNLLIRGSSIVKESGAFFLQDGVKVQGEVIHVGNIAKFGMAQGSTFQLAPAGSNQFKVWDITDLKLEVLAAGKPLREITLFTFQSSEKALEKKEPRTLWQTLEAGGATGWVIVFLGLVAIVLSTVRGNLLKRSSRNTEKIGNRIYGYMARGDIESALDYCESHDGSVARVMKATLRNINKGRQELEDIIAENIIHESKLLDRFGSIILVFAAVAPLLGLLGTVTGMISTFDIITEFGTGDPKMLSGGISEALITTKMGLVVAIPCLLVGNILSGWSGSIKTEMEKSALKISNAYRKYTHSGV